MASKPKINGRSQPTGAELEILQALELLGSATVRQVQAALVEQTGREMGYTTVLKFMQIMHGKGLLERDESEKSHVYHAAHPLESTRRDLVSDMLDRVFGGSALALVSQALGARKVPEAELQAIRDLLNFHQKNTK